MAKKKSTARKKASTTRSPRSSSPAKPATSSTPATTVPELTGEELLVGGGTPYIRVEVPLPKNGSPTSTVHLRHPTAAEALAFASSRQESGDQGDEIQIRLVTQCLVDKNGKRLLTDEDFVRVKQMPASAFIPIIEALTDLISTREARAAKNS